MLLEECFDASFAVVTDSAGPVIIRTEMEMNQRRENIPISCVGHHIEQNLDSITVFVDSCGGWKDGLNGMQDEKQGLYIL